MSDNPYEPTSTSHLKLDRQPANRRQWLALGFVVACIPFAALGAYGLYADAQYAATLPPNTPRCGNGAMAAMFMIFPVSPILGCMGAGIGFLSAIVYDALTVGGAHIQSEDGR